MADNINLQNPYSIWGSYGKKGIESLKNIGRGIGASVQSFMNKGGLPSSPEGGIIIDENAVNQAIQRNMPQRQVTANSPITTTMPERTTYTPIDTSSIVKKSDTISPVSEQTDWEKSGYKQLEGDESGIVYKKDNKGNLIATQAFTPEQLSTQRGNYGMGNNYSKTDIGYQAGLSPEQQQMYNNAKNAINIIQERYNRGKGFVSDPRRIAELSTAMQHMLTGARGVDVQAGLGEANINLGREKIGEESALGWGKLETERKLKERQLDIERELGIGGIETKRDYLRQQREQNEDLKKMALQAKTDEEKAKRIERLTTNPLTQKPDIGLEAALSFLTGEGSDIPFVKSFAMRHEKSFNADVAKWEKANKRMMTPEEKENAKYEYYNKIRNSIIKEGNNA